MVRIESHSVDFAMAFKALKNTNGKANPMSASAMLLDFKSAHVLVDPDGAIPGLQSGSLKRHSPQRHWIRTRHARESKAAQRCLSGCCMTSCY